MDVLSAVLGSCGCLRELHKTRGAHECAPLGLPYYYWYLLFLLGLFIV